MKNIVVGMEPIAKMDITSVAQDIYKYPVFLDGRLVGFIPEDLAVKSTSYLRTLKVKGEDVPITTEIVLVPKKQV